MPEWAVASLDGEAFSLVPGPGQTPCLRAGAEAADASPTLLRSQSDGRESWVLTGAARVNGMPLLTGIRVLRDRDELEIGGLCAFFSTETLALVEPLPHGDTPVFCPRCKQEIAKQSAAVQCPQCRVWHHQSDDLPCWTYSERCALCDQPTDLSADYRWTPEEL
jgi:hypothetical protein